MSKKKELLYTPLRVTVETKKKIETLKSERYKDSEQRLKKIQKLLSEGKETSELFVEEGEMMSEHSDRVFELISNDK